MMRAVTHLRERRATFYDGAYAMNPILTKCPVCQGDLMVTRLHCPACETSLEGAFDPTVAGTRLQEAFSPEQLKPLLPFSRLTAEQLQFVLTFVRCEGRFNRMEDELGLSYPTLRNRLNEIIRAMGYEPSRDEANRPDSAKAESARAERALSAAERQEVLELLSRGEIDMEAAKRRLRGEQ
jgi:hypothetical protein